MSNRFCYHLNKLSWLIYEVLIADVLITLNLIRRHVHASAVCADHMSLRARLIKQWSCSRVCMCVCALEIELYMHNSHLLSFLTLCAGRNVTYASHNTSKLVTCVLYRWRCDILYHFWMHLCCEWIITLLIALTGWFWYCFRSRHSLIRNVQCAMEIWRINASLISEASRNAINIEQGVA